MPRGGPALDNARLFNVTVRLDALSWNEEMEASVDLRTAMEGLVERGMRFTQSPCFSLQRLIGELLRAEGDLPAAENALAAAIDSCEREGVLLELARTRLVQAQLLIEAGRHEEASAALRVASTIAAECGAIAVEERCATLAQRGGIDAFDLELTKEQLAPARPLDVLVEWARGATLEEIAETLLLDVATAEGNLKQARATYRVGTRNEASEVLARLGVGGTRDPQPATSVFLFTDIVDSTPANVRLGDRLWAQVVGLHDAKIRESVERHGGRVIKTIGDGTFAAFPAVDPAVSAAREIQGQPPFQRSRLSGRPAV